MIHIKRCFCLAKILNHPIQIEEKLEWTENENIDKQINKRSSGENIIFVHCSEKGCIGFPEGSKIPTKGNLDGREGYISQCIPTQGCVQPISHHYQGSIDFVACGVKGHCTIWNLRKG